MSQEKKVDPTYVRLSYSNKLRVQVLAQQFGNIDESKVIDWMVGLGLDAYEFYQKHFVTVPAGLNFRTSKNGEEE